MNFYLSVQKSFKKSFSFKPPVWLGIIFVLFLLFFLTILFNVFAWKSLALGDVKLAKKLFVISKPIPNLSSALSFRKIPLLETWRESVVVGQEVSEILDESSIKDDAVGWLVNEYDSDFLIDHLILMFESAEKSIVLDRFLLKRAIDSREITNFVRTLRVLNNEKKLGKKYLLIFQNSDEVRATGGFIGSYAVLDFTNSEFWRLNIRDIYDPSGLSPSKDSPAGHSTFLSEGKGLLLHDANWSPEFSRSAEDILWFFERIENDPQRYDGVIALNFSTLEKVVSWLGDIYLPDEKEFIYAEDLSTVLRERRSEFFPGSNQKENSLSSLQSALWLKVMSLNDEDIAYFSQAFLREQIWKDVQIFSKDEQTQAELSALDLTGDLYSYDQDEIFIFPVESNVGINKANNWVGRSIYLEKNDDLIRLKIVFDNAATIIDRPSLNLDNIEYKTASHLSYVNYHRFITSDNLKLISVKSGNEVLDNWDKNTITSYEGKEYQQYGFLVVVPESSTREVVADFLVIKDDVNKDEVILQKQSGILYENKFKGFGSHRFFTEDVE
jgi:hypothetical protein